MIMPYIVQCRSKSRPGVGWTIQNLACLADMVKKLLIRKSAKMPAGRIKIEKPKKKPAAEVCSGLGVLAGVSRQPCAHFPCNHPSGKIGPRLAPARLRPSGQCR